MSKLLQYKTYSSHEQTFQEWCATMDLNGIGNLDQNNLRFEPDFQVKMEIRCKRKVRFCPQKPHTLKIIYVKSV